MKIMGQVRKHWLDIAKGVTIILMVVGHTTVPHIVSDFIYCFHMPLFFIASGITSSYMKHSPLGYINHKAHTVMLPFITYSIIVSFALYLIGKMVFSHLILNGWEGYALWFIPVLYLSSILTMLISFTKNVYLRCGFMISMFLLGSYLSCYQVSLPWTLSTVPYATFLVLIGNELKHIQKWIEAENHYWDIALLFMVTVMVSHFWHLDLAWNHITPVIPLTIGAMAGTLMIFRLSVWIERHIKWCALLLQKVGQETYIVVAFSQVTIMYMNHFFAISPILKYAFLVIALVSLKYAKDSINRLLKVKIL